MNVSGVFGRKVIGLIAVIVSLVFAVPASAIAAAACSPKTGLYLSGGAGHPGTVFAGSWRCDGGVGFCVDFPRHEPEQAGGVLTVSSVPGANAKESKMIFHIDGKYRLTGSRSTAAKAQIAVWELKHRKGSSAADGSYRTYRNKVLKPKYPALWSGAKAMIAEAEKAVSARLAVRLSPGAVGTTRNGKAVLTSSSGAALSGYTVKLSVNRNGKLSRTRGKTNSNGVVGFKLTTLSSGTVKVNARAIMPSISRAVLTVPGGSLHQRILIAKYNRSIAATASYVVTKEKAVITSQCDTDCDGQATVTAKVCSEGSPMRVFVMKNGSSSGSFDVSANKCVSKDVRAVDDDDLVFEACHLDTPDGKCVDDRYVAGKYHVVCPPWAKAFVTVACDCQETTAQQVAYLAPNSTRGYKGLLKLPNGEVREYDLTNGELKEVALPEGVTGQIYLGFKVYADSTRTSLLKTVWFPDGVDIN